MIRSLLAASGLALAAGCATAPPAAGGPWTTGRLSLRVDAVADQPAQSLSAAFELSGSSRGGELRLVSPLGTQLAAASWSPGTAILRTPVGERRFDSLDELARQALGERLPLAALPDWLAGRPWPGEPHRSLDDGFEQLGWRVQTLRLAEGFITAARAAPPAVQLRVKLDRAEP